MKCIRFTEEQIIGSLKECAAGVSVADLCRKHGVSDASIHKWKAKFGVMDEAILCCFGLENTTVRLINRIAVSTQSFHAKSSKRRARGRVE